MVSLQTEELKNSETFSSDFIAQVDLNVKGMVKNSKLAKSINDVAW
jgi:transposase